MADITHDLDESESVFSFISKTNQKIFFDDQELLIILKIIKKIVRTYLKIKDLFSFKFLKKGV